MIQAEEMQNGGMDIVDVDRVLDRVHAEFISRSVNQSAFDSAAGQPRGEAFRMVVPPVAAG